MSIWKRIAKVASALEERERLRQEERAKAKELKALPVLNYSIFMARIYKVEDCVASLFRNGGAILVQDIRNSMQSYLSDLCRVVSDLVESKTEATHVWVEQTLKLYENSICHLVKQLFDSFNGAAEMRHSEADDRSAKRQNVIVNNILGLFKHQQAMELSNSDRYLNLLERIRVLDVQNIQQHNINFNTLIALFENLTEQVQRKQRVVTEYKTRPVLGWFFEQADSIIDLGAALSTLRDDPNANKEAQIKVIRCLRAMLSDVSITNVQDELEEKLRQWGAA